MVSKTLNTDLASSWNVIERDSLPASERESLTLPVANEDGTRTSGLYYLNIYKDYTMPQNQRDKSFIYNVTLSHNAYGCGFYNHTRGSNHIWTDNVLSFTVPNGEHNIIWTLGTPSNTTKYAYFDDMAKKTVAIGGTTVDDIYSPEVYGYYIGGGSSH